LYTFALCYVILNVATAEANAGNSFYGLAIWPHVAHHDYEPVGFCLRLGWKDLRLALQTAQESAAPMPIGSFLRDRMLSAMAKWRGDMDWSAIALGATEDAGPGAKT
jgi:3-hydroxyisobutyrate dehydrogenase-like beta-hydroxyacid dehydrogenase